MSAGATRAAAAALLLAFALQAVVAVFRDSVTVDEFVHLPVGLEMLTTGELAIDPINPPLSRMLPALPLLVERPAFEHPPGIPHWALGYHLMAQNAESYPRLFLWPRLLVVLEALLLALLVHEWARAWYGAAAGLAALFLFAFAPSMLAHGHLVTADLAGALGLFACAWAGWRFTERPEAPRAAVFGAALGIAPALKTSALPVEIVIVALAAFGAGTVAAGAAARRRLSLLALALGLGLLTLNAAWGFQGTGARLGDLPFQDAGRLRQVAGAAPGLRLPLPAPFLLGLDLGSVGHGTDDPESYLAGEWSHRGWWYYHLVAFALKTPLPMLAWALAALAAFALGGSPRGRSAWLVLPAVAVFAANAALNPLNIGVRHVLPAEPFLFVAAAPLVVRGLTGLRAAAAGARLAGAATALGLVWYAAGTVLAAPRWLEYFNEAAGRPRPGAEWLVDSNLDWGQDLIRLRETMEARGWPTVALAYFGGVNPLVYGIRFTALEPGSRGIAVVSPTLLAGRSYFAWQGPDRLVWSPFGAYAWLRERTPVGRVGAMYVYDLGQGAGG